MRKFFFDSDFSGKSEFEITGENFKHLKVLRIRNGSKFLAGDISGNEFQAELVSLQKNKATAKILGPGNSVNPARRLILYAAMPKNNKFEDIIFKCSQAGVSEFVPVITSRTEHRPQASERFYERCAKKARHGSEISGRASIPTVRMVTDFRGALQDFSSRNLSGGIIFWEEEKEKLIGKNDYEDSTAIFTGPEGGFSPEEISAAAEAGLRIRSLGALVMDVETACIAASALLLCREG